MHGREDNERRRALPRAFPHVLAALIVMLSNTQSRADDYDSFNAFAADAFGAEQDSLVYEEFGFALAIESEVWIRASAHSAAIGFVTNLPATSSVEYGTMSQYDRQSPVPDRPYSIHLHHLTNLQPGVNYNFRIVASDARGQVSTSGYHTFTTPELPTRISIPGTMSGPPYVLATSGGYYLLTEDIDAPRTAFELRADDVVLDLGGHTVTYNNEHQTLSGESDVFINESGFGVKSVGADRLTICNGRIRQGLAQNGAHNGSIGFNPVFLDGSVDFEIAGLVIEYGGPQMVGLYARYPAGSNEIHHSVFLDRGSEIRNRHGMGSRSIGVNGAVASIHAHHNLVKRTRQSAIDGRLIHDNEIYIDSYSTNSYGIDALQNDREAYRNRIFGTGYHVVAIGWGRNNWWHDNFIHLAGQGPTLRFPEYGNQESLNGIRLTQYFGATNDYADNIVERNLIIISDGTCSSDGECTQARGIQFFSDPRVTGNEVRSNTIKVVMPEQITQAACIVTQGDSSRCGTEAPMLYSNNTLISNIANVRIGDYYGVGCNHWFLDNHMVRWGSRPDYRTVIFDAPFSTVDHHFYDTRTSAGASLDLVSFSDPEQRIAVGWTLTVTVLDSGTPVPGAGVSFHSVTDSLLAAGFTDGSGEFSARATAYREGMNGRIPDTPIAVTVTVDGAAWSRSVELLSAHHLIVELDTATGVADSIWPPPLQLTTQPNVLRDSTRISWGRELALDGLVEVFDVRGRCVRAIPARYQSQGLTWDGRDSRGDRVASGVYFVQLSAGLQKLSSRVLVMR